MYTVPNEIFRGFTQLERYLYTKQELVLTKGSQGLECLTCGIYQGLAEYRVYETGRVGHPDIPHLIISEDSHWCPRSAFLPSMKPARYEL